MSSICSDSFFIFTINFTPSRSPGIGIVLAYLEVDMRTLIVLLLFPLLVQGAVPAETLLPKRISDSQDMDRISREVVRISQFRSSAEFAKGGKDEAWRNRHPIAFGSLVGFGIGFGYAVFIAVAGGDTNLAVAGSLFFGGIGAGIGALIGSFF
jgi:hypothetical protein